MYHPLPLTEQEHSKFSFCCNHIHNHNVRFLKLFIKYYAVILIQDVFHSLTVYLILAYLGDMNLLKGLIPHLVAIVFTGAISIYIAASDGAKSAIRMWRSGNQNSYRFICLVSLYWLWCLILGPLIFFICVVFMIMIFPWTTFQWTVLHASSHYAGRLFEGTPHEHITSILDYTLNHRTSTQVKHHIIACNYYLMTMLSAEIESNVVKPEGVKCKEPQTLINYIATTHNSNVGEGVSKMSWKDLRVNNKVQGADDHGSGDLIFLIWFLLLLVYDFIFLSILFMVRFEDLPVSLHVMGIMAIVLSVGCFLVEVKILVLLYYCYHLLPFIGNVKGLKMDEKFRDVEGMMENIMVVYDIMYGSLKEIELVMDGDVNVLHDDIGKIIVEYLWCPLPVYQDDTIDLNELTLCNERIDE